MVTTKKLLRDPKLATATGISLGIKNRTPRSSEYAGPHSIEIVQTALKMAKQHNVKIPCSPRHFVYPSGLIVRRGKIKRG